jgi:hypothetical protein
VREREREIVRVRVREMFLTLLWHLSFVVRKEDFEYHFLEPWIWVWKPKFRKKLSVIYFLLPFYVCCHFQVFCFIFPSSMLRGGGEKKSFGTKLKQLLKCCFSFHNPTDSEIRERERACDKNGKR